MHRRVCLPRNDNGFLLTSTAVDNWPGNKVLCAPIIGSQQGIRTERGQQTIIFWIGASAKDEEIQSNAIKMVIEAPLNFCPDDNVIKFVFFISPCV